MARYTGPSCRLCRREGAKLFLKGNRCVSEKCTFVRREYAPGQHGKSRIKLSNYGTQLREKQKVKRIYGVLERQFRHYFSIAAKTKGVTGAMLLQLLERRLDNVVFQAHFATSRKEGRQAVGHEYVYVNKRRVNIASYLIKQGDIIEIKKTDEKHLKKIRDNIEKSKDRALPGWLNIDAEHLKAEVVRLPERDDIQLPIREQLIVELYSK